MSKAALYANSLDLARRLSLFQAVHPVDAQGRVANVGGAAGGEGADGGMDWKELVRKFGKHVVGREGESLLVGEDWRNVAWELR